MANCDKQLRAFGQKIILRESRRENLDRGRKALEKKINSYFETDKPKFEVEFKLQGSFAMNTVIDPVPVSGYDVDNGVYISSDEKERPTVETLHTWVVDAVDGHASNVIDKNACVRVEYAQTEDAPFYHVDMPIYWVDKYGMTKYAHKIDDFIASDPLALVKWFKIQCADSQQLVRIVRYMKAWADILRGDMPKGIVLTILCAQQYVANERDDVAFNAVLKAILNSMKQTYQCLRPTTPIGEDLLLNTSASKQNYLLDRLEAFVKSTNEALEMESDEDACRKWRFHFDDRFPIPDQKTIDEARKVSAAMSAKTLAVTGIGKITSSAFERSTPMMPTRFHGSGNKEI